MSEKTKRIINKENDRLKIENNRLKKELGVLKKRSFKARLRISINAFLKEFGRV